MDRLLIKYRSNPVDLENWLDAIGCRVLNGHYQIDLLVIQVPPELDNDAFVEELRLRPDVIYVEQDAALDAKVLSTGTDPMAFRNDAIFDAMRIAEAHAITTGREDCVIGVLDSGLDITNPDFAGQVVTGMIFDRGIDRRAGSYPFAVNIRELFSYPSSYSLTGFKVLVFVNRFDTFPAADQYATIYGNEALTVQLPNPYIIPAGSDCTIWITGDADMVLQTPAQIGTMGGVQYGDIGLAVMKDHYGHGTGTAGVIVAKPENDFGVRGIAPRCKVMPLKVFDAYGYMYISSLVAAFMFVGNNLRGVNCSFGITIASQWTQAIADALQFATERALVVVASGNSSTKDPFHEITTYDTAPYPGASPGVITVSGTCYRDGYHKIAQFAQRYANVAICAPATNWALTSPTYYNAEYADWKAGVTLDGQAGTSFASPATAAVTAGLMFSAAMDAGVDVADLPTRQALMANIKTILAESASTKPVTTYNGASAAGTGAGLIDAGRAVRAIAGLPDLLVTATGKAVVGVPMPVDVDAKTWGDGFYKLHVYEDGVLIDTLSLDTAVHHATYSYTAQGAGEKRLAFKAVDKSGASSKKGIKVTVVAIDTPTVAAVPLYDVYPYDVSPPTLAQETESGKYNIFSSLDGYSLPVVKNDNLLRCVLGSHAGAGLTFTSMSVYVDGVLNTTKTDLAYGEVTCTLNTITPGYHTLRVVVAASNGTTAESTTKMVRAPDITAFMETPTVTDGVLYISGFGRGRTLYDTGSGSVDYVDIGFVDVYLDGALFHEGYSIRTEEQFFQTAIQLPAGSAPPLVALHWRPMEVEAFEDYNDVTAHPHIVTTAQAVAVTKTVTPPEAFPVPPTTTAVQQSGHPAKLIADETATIYYTTDGTGPSQVAGVPQGSTRLYTSALSYNEADVVDGVITVKYFGVSDGGAEATNTSILEAVAPAEVGVFTIPAVALQPVVSAPTLTGVQRGSFTMPAVTLTPTVTAPTLNGVSVAVGSGAFTLPAVTLRPVVTAPRLFGMTGGASIRAPSGQLLNLRRIDGTPFTILSI